MLASCVHSASTSTRSYRQKESCREREDGQGEGEEVDDEDEEQKEGTDGTLEDKNGRNEENEREEGVKEEILVTEEDVEMGVAGRMRSEANFMKQRAGPL